MTGLAITGGRVLDPGQGIDGPATVEVDDAAITAIAPATGAHEPDGTGPARRAVDASGLIVTPGPVDLHTHLYQGVSHYGIDADVTCLGRGVTTAVDAGSSGAQTFPGLRRFIIEPSRTRILAFLNIAVQGMISRLVGELEDLRWASVEQAVSRAREHPDVIIGIKVRLGYQMVGTEPAAALRRGREAADILGLPLMVHVIDMHAPISWLLPYLGRGDVVTHCFHGNSGGVLDSRGRLYPEVWDARERGVLFDVGHGAGAFAYRVARSAIEQGFAPDTISSDLHAHNVNGPVWDQATTLSKLLHVGMDLADVIRATTATPAGAVRRQDSLGALVPGREADITAFELRAGSWRLPDAAGASEVVERLLVPRLVVRAGQVSQLDPDPAVLLAARLVMQVTAVTGGIVVAPDGSRRADVLISGEKIAALGHAEPGRGRQIDATGCYVLPGGVDPHTHLLSGVSRAAAAAARGGTTTALSFTNPESGDNDLSCLLRRRAEVAEGAAAIDIGLHAMLGDPERVTADDLAAIRHAGSGAIKVFLAYPRLGIMCSPTRLFELMTQARRLGLLVQVHCENGPLIEALQTEGLAAGHRGAALFAGTRPPEVEAESVASVLATAAITRAPCYLVHLSSADAMDQIRLARSRPRPPVFAEVCLHHLVLDDRRVTGADAGRFLVCPPLRTAEHVEALWQAIADGTIDAVGSDHCQVGSAVSDEIPAEPGGTGGLEYGLAGIGARLPLLLSEGLARGVPIARLVQLACENPARIFGHYPRKGALAPGSDADIVVYDPAGERVLGGNAFGDSAGPSIYAGLRQRGTIRAVVLRGRSIASYGDSPSSQAGRGRYLPAGRRAAPADFLPSG